MESITSYSDNKFSSNDHIFIGKDGFYVTMHQTNKSPKTELQEIE